MEVRHTPSTIWPYGSLKHRGTLEHLLRAGNSVHVVHVSVKHLLQEDTFQPGLFLAPLLLESVPFCL